MLKALWRAFVNGLIDEKEASSKKIYSLFKNKVQNPYLLENIVAKIDVPVLTKTGKNLTLWERTYLYGSYWGSTPFHGPKLYSWRSR